MSEEEAREQIEGIIIMKKREELMNEEIKEEIQT